MEREVKRKRTWLGLGLKLLAFAGLLAVLAGPWATSVFADPDPNGAATLAADPKAPVNYVWVLVCAFLVFIMQGGFALVESGFCRAKNAVNLMMKNTMDFSIGSIVYMAVGFAFMFGAD